MNENENEKQTKKMGGIVSKIIVSLFLLGVLAMPFYASTQKNLTNSIESIDKMEKDMHQIEANGYSYCSYHNNLSDADWSADVEDDELQSRYNKVEKYLADAALEYDNLLNEYKTLSRKKKEKLDDYLEETYDADYDSFVYQIRSYKIDKAQFGEERDNTYVMQTVLNDINQRREESLQWHSNDKDYEDKVLLEGYITNTSGLSFIEPVLEVRLYKGDTVVDTRTESLMQDGEIWNDYNDARYHMWVEKDGTWDRYRNMISYKITDEEEEE